MRLYKGKPLVPEQELVNNILDYLRGLGLRPVHHRTSGNIIGVGGRVRFGRTRLDQRGAADIFVAYQGMPVAIEVKRADEPALRPDQAEFLLDWQKPRSGGKAIVARSLEDVVVGLRKLRIGTGMLSQAPG